MIGMYTVVGPVNWLVVERKCHSKTFVGFKRRHVHLEMADRYMKLPLAVITLHTTWTDTGTGPFVAELSSFLT